MTSEQQKKFSYWQWRTIIGTMIGYIVFYLVRKNFSFAIPGLTAEYGISKTSFGAIMTIAGLIYGLSKFVNGVLADRTDGRWHMVTGLSICTLTSFLFGAGAYIAKPIVAVCPSLSIATTLVLIFSVLWIVNNAFQGCGFPPCNRLITHWVPSDELATKMSIWNTSHSIGAALAGVICGILIMGYMGTDLSGDENLVSQIALNLHKDITDPVVLEHAQHVGAWQWAFWIPGILGVLGVIFIIWCLRDTPKSVGLPELNTSSKKEDVKKEEKSEEFKKFLNEKVFHNPVIWALALADFFVYIIRFAVLDWGPTFLKESCGLPTVWAGATVIIFEALGVIGMLIAGWFTDKVMGGRGARTCVFCMIGATVSILAFCMITPDPERPIISIIQLCMLAVAGMFIYGPQALIGVIASNQATRRAASTANGVIGFVSYISVAVSGIGFGFISDHFGWQWVFVSMVLMAFVGLCTLLPLWKLKRDAYEEEPAK